MLGYALTPQFLTPYRGVHYHLKEWAQVLDGCPSNPKELFNLRHSSLRNIIERVFGVVKRKFKILRVQSEYSLTSQIQLVPALACITNIIHWYEGEEIFESEDNDTEIEGIHFDEAFAQAMEQSSAQAYKDAAKFWDELAQQMWTDYQNYLVANSM
jgi:DDE superfamily endonuclease